ncbi:MAG: hypothetical protein ACYC5K_01890 [Saccharofermentanales bacterium]
MNKKITIVASAGLCLYALYKIVQTILSALDPNQFIFEPIGQRILYFLTSSIDSWGLLALGLCGLVLAYAEINKEKNLEFQNQFAKIRRIVFSAFLILTVGSFFRFIYFSYLSFQSYEIAIASGADVQTNGYRFIVNTIVISIISILPIWGKTLFGIFLINKNGKLVKPLIITYFTGFIFTLIFTIYRIITTTLFYIQLRTDTTGIPNFGSAESHIFTVYFSLAGDILILVASLIIILYGINNEKIEAT